METFIFDFAIASLRWIDQTVETRSVAIPEPRLLLSLIAAALVVAFTGRRKTRLTESQSLGPCLAIGRERVPTIIESHRVAGDTRPFEIAAFR